VEPVATYNYGVAEKGRFEGPDGKDFKWRMKGGDWVGLNGAKMSELPLYGDYSRETVFVCEGEKATDACIKAGLSAVCQGGGGSAKDFGDQFQVLRGKAVILWPDNDPVGRELMHRIRREVDGVASRVRMVAPSLPIKGDAFDYFASGGSVDQLVGTDMSPSVEQTEYGYAVTIPDLMGTAVFLCEELDAPKPGDLNTELTVAYEAPGKSRESFSARTNLLALSSRRTLASELEGMIPLGKGEWARFLNKAVEMVREAWVSSVQSVEYADVSLDVSAPRFRVDNFLPEGAVTTIFGMGDAGKGQLAIHLSLCVAAGRAFMGRSSTPGRVMYCDWEDDEQEWANRLFRHSLGMRLEVPDALSYYPGRGIPLQQQVTALQREINRRGVDVLIVDSAVPACGGDPNAPDVPGPFFNALRRLGCTVILIAHNNKSEDDRYPIGSIMWHNLSRCTWYVSRSGSEDFTIGLYHKKRNRMRPQRDFGVRVVFDEDDAGPVTLYSQDISADIDQFKHMKPWDKVQTLLQDGPMPRRELAKAAGMSLAQLRLMIHRRADLVADAEEVSLRLEAFQ
jgi:hypothetical protein